LSSSPEISLKERVQSPAAAESRMILSARPAIPGNSGEEGEKGPGYQRKTGRSETSSGPARLSRCSAEGPSAWIVICSAQTWAPPPPRTLQKAESPKSRFVCASSGSEIRTIAREG
jgi:hypothetical protein